MMIVALLLNFVLAVALAKKYVPLVLLHGMGDSSNSEGIKDLSDEIRSHYSGIFIHSIQIGGSERSDVLSSYFDNLNRQVDEICQQLSVVEELKDGFDAIGFSQGGQILRAYVERCNKPKVRNLITVGSQHQGIMGMAGCSANECNWWQKIIKNNAYSDFAQNRIVQAQYFKDLNRMEEYLSKNHFLTDINNERSKKNEKYKKNLSSLKNFVMFMFTGDHQVIPKESSWFWYYGEDGEILALKDQPIYKEDWIGLKTLDRKKALHFLSIEDEHMHLPDGFVEDYLKPWIGE